MTVHLETREINSKVQVCAEVNARLLVDDSAENAMQCVTASPAVPVLTDVLGKRAAGDNRWRTAMASEGLDRGRQAGTVHDVIDRRSLASIIFT